ncbi:uncharacterized protein LOC134274125 isoform X2 [Saccostrea cucullata]|uniref:uncharacterized protein LOC134274125 isoform X2 n=1 Tax=Saccostrea cuccullata TaxID=36930 RepID=UPI002ED6936E
MIIQCWLFLLLIVFIAIFFIGGVLFYLRPSLRYRCKLYKPCHWTDEYFEKDHTIDTIKQNNESTKDKHTSANHSEKLEGNDEIRHDQHSGSSTGSSPALLIRKIKGASDDRYLPSHSLYEKISFHGDTHISQFTKEQSIADPDMFWLQQELCNNEKCDFLKSSSSLDFSEIDEVPKFQNHFPLLHIQNSNGERTMDSSNNKKATILY